MVPHPCWTGLFSVESLFSSFTEELPSCTQGTQGTLLGCWPYQMIVDCEIVTLLRPCSVSCGGIQVIQAGLGAFGVISSSAQEYLGMYLAMLRRPFGARY